MSRRRFPATCGLHEPRPCLVQGRRSPPRGGPGGSAVWLGTGAYAGPSGGWAATMEATPERSRRMTSKSPLRRRSCQACRESSLPCVRASSSSTSVSALESCPRRSDSCADSTAAETSGPRSQAPVATTSAASRGARHLGRRSAPPTVVLEIACSHLGAHVRTQVTTNHRNPTRLTVDQDLTERYRAQSRNTDLVGPLRVDG